MIKFDINNIDSPEINALLKQMLISKMPSFRDEENEASIFKKVVKTIDNNKTL